MDVSLVVSIVGVGLALCSLVFTVRRNRHRAKLELNVFELLHGDRPRLAVRITLRNFGRAMGVRGVQFHPDERDLASGLGFSVEPLPSQDSPPPDLLAGDCILADGEVRTWAYIINVEGHQGPLRLAATVELATGRTIRSNSCVLETRS